MNVTLIQHTEKDKRSKNEKGLELHIAGNEEGHLEFASGWQEKYLLFALMSSLEIKLPCLDSSVHFFFRRWMRLL